MAGGSWRLKYKSFKTDSIAFFFFKPLSKNVILSLSSHRCLIVPQGGGAFLTVSMLWHFLLLLQPGRWIGCRVGSQFSSFFSWHSWCQPQGAVPGGHLWVGFSFTSFFLSRLFTFERSFRFSATLSRTAFSHASPPPVVHSLPHCQHPPPEHCVL